MEHDLVAIAADIEPVERAKRRGGLAFGGPEAAEIMPPEQAPSGLAYRPASSGVPTCQTRPRSSAGGARRFRIR